MSELKGSCPRCGSKNPQLWGYLYKEKAHEWRCRECDLVFKEAETDE